MLAAASGTKPRRLFPVFGFTNARNGPCPAVLMGRTIMANGATALGTLVNIILDPKKALDDIRGHTGWLWYPLLITLGVTLGVLAWYYATADWDVVHQQIMDYIAGRHYSAEQTAQISKGLTRSGILAQTLIGSLIIVALIYLIQALYLFFVAKVAGYEVQGYGQWFSFTCWTYFPGVLAYLLLGVSYAIAGKEANLANLDVTSLNTLIFKLHPGDSWFGLANTLHLTTFWVFGLLVLGVARWTKQSIGKSAVVALAPHALLYGLWALFKLI